MKKVFFMMSKLLTDFRRAVEKGHDLCDDPHNRELGYYYFKFKEDRVAGGKDQKLISKFDENGIPINKTYIDVTDKDYVYFPISIGQMGLAVYHTYLETKSENDKARFLKFAEWFACNAEITDNLGVRWLTDVALPAYRRKAPWQSAFSQSRGISILLRAYQLTGNKEWLDKATLALKPFAVEVKYGGVMVKTNWGPFYEEYTAEVPTLVLNGMIFSLWGLYDYVRVEPNNEMAQNLFVEGVDTLKNILAQFNLGYWSRYNLCDVEWYPDVDPATIGYQKLHILQLRSMYEITGEELFSQYGDIFEKQLNIMNIVRMYRVKYKALKGIGRL